MTPSAYPIEERLARAVHEWAHDIRHTLRVAESDGIHGHRLLRDCLQDLEREMGQFEDELDEDRCEACGAPPSAQPPRHAVGEAVRASCRACGAS